MASDELAAALARMEQAHGEYVAMLRAKLARDMEWLGQVVPGTAEHALLLEAVEFDGELLALADGMRWGA
jgi:hypothetical protein